jgi:hypothetical protein
VLIVVAGVLFLFGAGKAAGLLTQHTDRHTRTLAAAPTIVVSAETADVKIVATDRSDIRLTTKEQRSMWGGGHATVVGDARGLRLEDRCDGLPAIDDPCDVDYRLEVPRTTAVRVTDGTGDVHADNLEGSADLSSGTGNLHVTGMAGPLRLRTDTGDVHVEAPASDISVQTATGDIDVVATHPQTIRAQAATGDIVLVVPDVTYAVDARSDAGDDTVAVRVDPASPRMLQAHTNSGDVVVAR